MVQAGDPSACPLPASACLLSSGRKSLRFGIWSAYTVHMPDTTAPDPKKLIPILTNYSVEECQAINARAVSLGLNRSAYLRHLARKDLGLPTIGSETP
jgi:hypothetical protein